MAKKLRKKLRRKMKGGRAEAKGKTPADFNPKDMKAGIAVEREHSNDPQIQSEISADHLAEDPRYYDKLKVMEATPAKTYFQKLLGKARASKMAKEAPDPASPMGQLGAGMRARWGSPSTSQSPPSPPPSTPAPSSKPDQSQDIHGFHFGKGEFSTRGFFKRPNRHRLMSLVPWAVPHIHHLDQPDVYQTLGQGDGEDEAFMTTPSESGLEKAADKKVKAKGVLSHHEADSRFVSQLIHKRLTEMRAKLTTALKNPETADIASQQAMQRYGARLVEEKKGGPKKLHLREKNKMFDEVVGGVFKEHPNKFHPSVSTANTKLANEAIAAWSIPEKTFCPGAGACKAFCYVGRGPMSWDNASIRRWMNVYASKSPGFVDEMSQIIQQMPKWAGVDTKDWDKIEGQKKATVKGKAVLQPIYAKRTDASGNPIHHDWTNFRIHDSGDFYSPEYADKWKQIISKNPSVNFYAYTKTLGESAEPESQGAHLKVDELRTLPNMKVIQSVGGKYDHLIDPDKPHAVIFESRDQAARAGYTTDSYNYDSIAADPKNTKIGLVIHGATAGFSLKNHIFRSPKLQERLKNVLPVEPEVAPKTAEAKVAKPKKAKVS